MSNSFTGISDTKNPGTKDKPAPFMMNEVGFVVYDIGFQSARQYIFPACRSKSASYSADLP